MASKFETSFGARLRKFEDAVQYVKNWPGYSPDRPEISIDALTQLVITIKQANEQETGTQSQYATAVAARSQLFNKDQGSVEKLLAPLKAAVSLKYGRQSSQAESIAGIIRSYRSSQLIKLPPDPANPDKQKTVSQSQRSYGSRTQFFSDIITTLSSYTDFTSSNPDLKITTLQQKLQQLTDANDAVAVNLQKIAGIRQDRVKQYQQMAATAALLKDYASSQYGNRSPQYKSLTALGI